MTSKKIFFLVSLLAIALMLVACGGGANEPTNEPMNEPANTTSNEPMNETTNEPITCFFVSDL